MNNRKLKLVQVFSYSPLGRFTGNKQIRISDKHLLVGLSPNWIAELHLNEKILRMQGFPNAL